MNSNLGKSSTARFWAGLLATLLFVPAVSHAQSGDTATGTGALYTDSTGCFNTADGAFALFQNTTGNYNTAQGYEALALNSNGYYNTATGSDALFSNTIGHCNTANGSGALYSNTNGGYNTASGFYSLYSNSTGVDNIASGYEALYSNTTGSNNTSIGANALRCNATGNANTAIGNLALYTNLSGGNNVAEGTAALYFNTSGLYNVALGAEALYNNTIGSSNIGLGFGAGVSITSGSNNIAIGNTGTASDTGIIRIGTTGTHKQTFIAGIAGTGVTGAAVYVSSTGQLGVLKSSARFKFDIHNIGAKSDKLMNLRPVTFRYKDADEDGTHPVQYGLIAEEVAKVYPDLVQYDKQGKPFTVYYHLLTPMMLDQLQKAHRQLETQQSEFNSFRTAIQSRSSAEHNQNAALLSQVSTLQHTVNILVISAFVLLVVSIAGAALYLTSRGHRLPSILYRVCTE